MLGLMPSRSAAPPLPEMRDLACDRAAITFACSRVRHSRSGMTVPSEPGEGGAGRTVRTPSLFVSDQHGYVCDEECLTAALRSKTTITAIPLRKSAADAGSGTAAGALIVPVPKIE